MEPPVRRGRRGELVSRGAVESLGSRAAQGVRGSRAWERCQGRRLGSCSWSKRIRQPSAPARGLLLGDAGIAGQSIRDRHLRKRRLGAEPGKRPTAKKGPRQLGLPGPVIAEGGIP